MLHSRKFDQRGRHWFLGLLLVTHDGVVSWFLPKHRVPAEASNVSRSITVKVHVKNKTDIIYPFGPTKPYRLPATIRRSALTKSSFP